MAFKKVMNFSDCPTIKIGGKNENEEPNPTQIEGYFMGSKTTPAKGDYGPGRLHFFKTQDGLVGVWGKAMMNNQLTPELTGQMVRVTYTGLGPKRPGKARAYLYDVEADADNTTDVSGVNLSVQAQEPTPEDTGSDDTDTDGDDDDQQEEKSAPRATPPKVAAKAPSAEQQAKIAKMLAGKKTA